MPASSRTELIEYLAAESFADLIGTEESSEIEFKHPHYSLQSGKGVVDFVADVASFANSVGGVILLGVRTAIDPNSHREMASDVIGVDPADVNPDVYRKLVHEHVHPLVHGLEFRWYPHLEKPADVRLFAIVISPQQDYDKPFLVDRSVVPSGKDKPLAHSFGWPTRSGSETHWQSVARVQQLISHGLRAASTLEVGVGSQAAVPDADAHLAYLEGLEGWSDWGVYAVQGLPPAEIGTIPDFHGQFIEGVRGWRGVRSGGFNLGLDWHRPEPAGGRLITAESSRTALLVSKSGVVTGGALASPDYLGWAHTQDKSPEELERLLVNQVPLIEFTTEVLRFAYECVGVEVGRSGWTLRAVGRHFLTRVPVNLDLRRGSSGFPPIARAALQDDFHVEVPGTGDAYRDARVLLGEVYGEVFGLGQDKLPFVREDSIDLAMIGG